MATIESLGLGSGVLTSDLVESIIGAEREAADLRLDAEAELVEARITAYGEVKSLLSSIDSAVSALASPSEAASTIASSSNESILTATTSSSATPGTYTVEVQATAKAHSLASDSYASAQEIVGTGKLVFTFGTNTYDVDGNLTGQEVNPDIAGATITIDDSNHTLSGIRDAINSGKFGVTASIVNDGQGYRLLITSDDTGEEQAMRIQALDSNGNELTDGLAALAYNPTQLAYSGIEETSAGSDALLVVNGLTITRSSNDVNEVINGVTLNLKSADVGTSVTITVEPDVETLSDNIQAFVDAYNSFKAFTDEVTAYNATESTGGILLGDSTLRSIQSQIRSLISQPITGLSGTSYRSLTELGVNTDQNNGYLLTFDTSAFKTALTESRSSVVGILAKTGTTTDSQITYVNDSINTKPGTYDVVVTQLATQAIYEGGSVAGLDFSSPVVIDDTNDQFTINVNGTTSRVTLTKGSYSSADDLSRELALQINSSDNIANKGYSVSVEYDETQSSFNIISNTYGSSSKVYFTSVDENTANTLGFNTLNSGTYKGVELTTLDASAFNGRGASTLAGTRSVAESAGINFASNNATFSLSVDGAAAVDVTVSQSASGNDLNGDGIFGDRQDTLQAIQTAIDSTALSGQVTASFDDSGYLIFTTTGTGASKSIEITAAGSSTADVLLGLDATDGAQTNGKDAGLTFGSDVSFRVQVDGTSGDSLVTLPAGTYATGNDLAAQLQASLQASIDADANLAPKVEGAETTTGSRDISSLIDFGTTNAGFTLNVSGDEQEIIINSSTGDNLADIQSAIDAAYGSGVVTASLDGTGLKLTTVATGHEEYIEVAADGRGAYTSSFGDITTGIDFTGDNASFTLTVGGTAIDVTVDGDGTAGTNDADSNLSVIQLALDEALVASGNFSAGDVVAKVDDLGQLYFETVSQHGIKNAATLGSNASIEVSNLAGSAATTLGMSAEVSSNGYDGLGLTTSERDYGYDLNVEVAYNYNADDDKGSFNITIGGQSTRVGFTDLDSTAISYLGLQDVSLYSEEIPTGQDVAGTINGVTATGNGQYLRAVDGNVAAKPGYYLGGEAADFSSSVVLDADNSTFSINIDGVEAEVQLNYPATYISGGALASALETAINNTSAFKSENISVSVDFSTDATSFAYNKFGIISNTTGSDSVVEITSVSAEAASIFGFVKGIGDGERGSDAVGQVDDASGLRLKITGGSVGDRGTVTYVSGFGDQLADLMESLLSGSDSVINTKLNSLTDQQTAIEQEKEDLDDRMTAQEARLKSQFSYNDAIIQTLNTTLDYVKQQFEVLNAAKNN
ncbi:flagellar filament capping protein FliD [Oceanobacter mangrovi]|uniref:flagellar filament capping protein FliD n=1 Tax=Oceanobacter mangrovi TaxID=2862510 RepID=UPI001C8D9177|nr:flagellar filament capping protein FliD [Oceanobacter mangrovi]